MAIVVLLGLPADSVPSIFVDSAQVTVPYLRAKAHDYYDQLGGGVSSDILEDAGDGRRIQALTDEVYRSCAKNDNAHGRITVSSRALASSIQKDFPMGEHFV
jgi:hypothetical protein